MSSRRAGEAQSKRVSNSFSIEALIAKDRKSTDKEDEESVAEARKHSEDARRVQSDVTRQSSSVELDVERLNRTHQSESSSTPARKPSVRDDDDDDDKDDNDDERQRSTERVSPVSDKPHHHHHHHHQYQQQQQRGHQYQHHLQQFHQLLTRPVMDSVHPFIRQNVLSSSQLALGAAAATDSLLRRPTAASALPAANSLFCCPPLPQGLSTTSHQRPAASREDELVPFYSWLLSRHGAFFNHRIHPAGRPPYCMLLSE